MKSVLIKPDVIMRETDISTLKLQELKRVSDRSRVGNAVPVGKSKAANRAKAKAARKARKK